MKQSKRSIRKFKYLNKDEVARLPKNPGVYAFKRERKFLYIGKAGNISQCLTSAVKGVKVMALAKKKNELYLEHRKNPIRLNSFPNSLKFMIIRLRDEAHRFAISYHKKLRARSLLNE